MFFLADTAHLYDIHLTFLAARDEFASLAKPVHPSVRVILDLCILD
jgi:hypothetical protein